MTILISIIMYNTTQKENATVWPKWSMNSHKNSAQYNNGTRIIKQLQNKYWQSQTVIYKQMWGIQEKQEQEPEITLIQTGN